MNQKLLFFCIIAVTAFAVSGCHHVESGAGRAFDNANGVIRTGRSKFWGPGDRALAGQEGGEYREESERRDMELVQP